VAETESVTGTPGSKTGSDQVMVWPDTVPAVLAGAIKSCAGKVSDTVTSVAIALPVFSAVR